MGPLMDFVGAKAAFFCGPLILTYLRDDFTDLPWRGCWDLPGGGREGTETPEACLLRELDEEFGLSLAPARLIYRRVLPSMVDPARLSVFFAGRLQPDEIAAIRFGPEGQRWQMMDVQAFLAHPGGIPQMQARTRQALIDLG
jgi:8-oxo-dGTP diphosphatase